jgi:hypothetical protein
VASALAVGSGPAHIPRRHSTCQGILSPAKRYPDRIEAAARVLSHHDRLRPAFVQKVHWLPFGIDEDGPTPARNIYRGLGPGVAGLVLVIKVLVPELCVSKSGRLASDNAMKQDKARWRRTATGPCPCGAHHACLPPVWPRGENTSGSHPRRERSRLVPGLQARCFGSSALGSSRARRNAAARRGAGPVYRVRGSRTAKILLGATSRPPYAQGIPGPVYRPTS